MQVLVISDVHGNLPALEYVLNEEKNADLVISLGDVVNYGPWSNECVELLDSLKNKVLLRGNHEDAFLDGAYPGSHPVVNAFFSVCYPEFRHKPIIQNYLQQYTYGNFCFVHTLGNQYIFPDTEVMISENTFIGHSHAIFLRTLKGFKLVNAGSVGQNRKNIDELNYVLWTPSDNHIELITKPFSADLLISEMKRKQYPDICLNYILSKRSAFNG